jgi:hypothetical protein
MEQKWITDRLPTAADGDRDGDVRMRLSPGAGRHHLVYWSYVGAGAPWQHTGFWRRPAEPAPTEADRIAALEQRVEELGRTTARLALSTADALESLRAQP